MDFSNRTHNLLRDLKIRCGKVERVIGGRPGQGPIRRLDLFGFLDQIAIHARSPYEERPLPWPDGIIGIQDTGGSSNSNGNARVGKLCSEELWPAAEDWLSAGGHIMVANWVKTKGVYQFRYLFVTLDTNINTEIVWKTL